MKKISYRTLDGGYGSMRGKAISAEHREDGTVSIGVSDSMENLEKYLYSAWCGNIIEYQVTDD